MSQSGRTFRWEVRRAVRALVKMWKGWEDGTSGAFGVSLSCVVGIRGFEMHVWRRKGLKSRWSLGMDFDAENSGSGVKQPRILTLPGKKSSEFRTMRRGLLVGNWV